MTQGTVEKLSRPAPSLPTLTKVAAYARVSSGKDAQLNSLSAQISYYNRMIQNHAGWLFCGVYADEAISGTKDDRANFNRLIEDCRAGKISLVITKSISRFARNTVTLLSTVRELKQLGVDVFFEEQGIHTLSGEGELMLTIMAGFAEEESLSVSENMKWRVKKNFEEGKPWSWRLFGYRHENGKFVIVPDEAEIVRRIYRDYLSGSGSVKIADSLNREGLYGREGHPWQYTNVLRILKNYNYTGNLILQKTFSENHLTKRRIENEGQLPKIHVEGSHEPIISLEDFAAVQEEIRLRAEANGYRGKRKTTVYPFSGMIVCAQCGKNYRRKAMRYNTVWICPTFNQKGKAACSSKQIPEGILTGVTMETVGDVDSLQEKVSCIRAENGNRLVFCMKDGSEITKHWEDRSRAESWTSEMRKSAAKKTKERWHGKNNSDTGNEGSAN